MQKTTTTHPNVVVVVACARRHSPPQPFLAWLSTSPVPREMKPSLCDPVPLMGDDTDPLLRAFDRRHSPSLSSPPPDWPKKTHHNFLGIWLFWQMFWLLLSVSQQPTSSSSSSCFHNRSAGKKAVARDVRQRASASPNGAKPRALISVSDKTAGLALLPFLTPVSWHFSPRYFAVKTPADMTAGIVHV
jgi:hypothetical protein